MIVTAVGTYEPVWSAVPDKRGGRPRLAGPDEDVITMTVAVALAVLEDRVATVSRVVLVTNDADMIEGVPTAVVGRAIGLRPDVPIDFRVGGAAATLDAVLECGAGALVVGVDLTAAGAAAGAVLTGEGGPGTSVQFAGRQLGSLPMRIRHAGADRAIVYQDPRVERELGWARVLDALRPAHGDVFVAGVPRREVVRLGASAGNDVPYLGSVAPIFLLAELVAARRSGRLIAIDVATGTAADVDYRPGSLTVARRGVPVDAKLRPAQGSDAAGHGAAEIPFSMPAYARAFEAKVGFAAARCSCGELSYPPRLLCLRCGKQGDTSPELLPRTGVVYSAVTVHTAVPGIPGPYALAIVSLDESPVRVLARVSDAGPADCRIGDHGRLALRLMAVREGVPDYGYAFCPDQQSVGL